MSRKVIPFSGNNSSNMKNTFSPITSSSFPLLSTSLVIIQLNFSPHPTTRKKCIHAVPTIVKQEQPLSQHLLHHDCHDMYIMLPYFFCLFSFVQILLYKKKITKDFGFSRPVHWKKCYSDALHQWSQKNVLDELGLQGAVDPGPGS